MTDQNVSITAGFVDLPLNSLPCDSLHGHELSRQFVFPAKLADGCDVELSESAYAGDRCRLLVESIAIEILERARVFAGSGHMKWHVLNAGKYLGAVDFVQFRGDNLVLHLVRSAN